MASILEYLFILQVLCFSLRHRFTNEMLSDDIFIYSLYVQLKAQKIKKNITPLLTYLFMNLDVIFNGIARGFKQLFNGQ